MFRGIIKRWVHTIYALSSGRGASGIAIVRISGPSARLALTRLAGFSSFDDERCLPKPRHAYFRRLVNPQSGQLIDRGLILFFPKPNSFTGEDVVELHVHGGPAVVKAVFNALSNLPDYRMAEPGEFMRRSFKNGKIDLGGAEAVSDLIAAETEAQHALAIGQIDRTQERVELYAAWRKSILGALASVEAWIDFSDSDDIEDDVMEKARSDMAHLLEEIRKRMTDARRGQRLREGVHVAIIGPPNAGKSSLMNALCRDDEVSIVSPIAGTTRDAIERSCNIAGYPIVLVDTAGLRHGTHDPVEKIGIERTKARARSADLLILILDASEIQERDLVKLKDPIWLDAMITKALPNVSEKSDDSASPIIVAFNKIDLLNKSAESNFLDDAMGRFSEQICGINKEAPTLIGGLRQIHHLKCASDFLENFVSPVGAGNEKDAVIRAEYLRLAVRELGKLTGEITNEDVLDQIFRTFCVGK